MAHGLDAEIGSVEVGKLADLVLWDPAFFAVRPHAVLKGGMIAWAAMGDANASIPTPQPILPRPMFGAAPGVAPGTVAGVGGPGGARRRPGRAARPRPAAGAGVVDAALGKADLPENTALPRIEVEPDTFAVRIDGELVEESPATELPMAQRYFLFDVSLLEARSLPCLAAGFPRRAAGARPDRVVPVGEAVLSRSSGRWLGRVSLRRVAGGPALDLTVSELLRSGAEAVTVVVVVASLAPRTPLARPCLAPAGGLRRAAGARPDVWRSLRSGAEAVTVVVVVASLAPRTPLARPCLAPVGGLRRAAGARPDLSEVLRSGAEAVTVARTRGFRAPRGFPSVPPGRTTSGPGNLGRWSGGFGLPGVSVGASGTQDPGERRVMLATLLLLADGRFPAGGHAYSAGVEAAVRYGDVVDEATLERYLAARLATTGVTEAAFAVAASVAGTDRPELDVS